MTEVYHDSPSKRKHYRLSVPIKIIYKNSNYDTVDWSIGGFKLKDFPEKLSAGSEIEVSLNIPFQNFVIGARQKAKVVWYNENDKTLAAEFIDMDKHTSDMLKYFSRCLISGEMIAVEDVIKRVDIPVTPMPKLETPEWQDQSFSHRLKRVSMFSFYLILGVMVFLYIVVTIYSYSFRMKVETGMVSIPRENIVSPVSGIVLKNYDIDGQYFKKNDPLIAVESSRKKNLVEAAEIDLQKVQHTLLVTKKRLNAYNKKLENSKALTLERIRFIKKQIVSLENELKTMSKNPASNSASSGDSAFPFSFKDASKQRHSSLKKQIEVLKQELTLQEQTLFSLKNGELLSGKKNEDNVETLTSAVAAAENEMALIQNRLKRLLQPVIIRAPFDGKVLKYSKSEGNFIAQGKPLVYLEKNMFPEIKVYITQKEASRISVGSKSIVFIPATHEHFEAVVVSVDRSFTYKGVDETEYQWRNKGQRNAIATLNFSVKGNTKEIKTLKSGLPAIVNFKVASQSSFVSWIQRNLLNE